MGWIDLNDASSGGEVADKTVNASTGAVNLGFADPFTSGLWIEISKNVSWTPG